MGRTVHRWTLVALMLMTTAAPATAQEVRGVVVQAGTDTPIPVDREAIRFAGVAHHVQRGPMWGEHTEEVVRGILGRSDEEYVQLVLDEVLR